MTDQDTQQTPESDVQVQADTAGMSPIVIFAVLPLLAVVAAIAMLMTSGGQPASQVIATPAPVTLPPPATQAQWGGKEAPDFEAVLLKDGSTVTLEDYRGRLVFLNFWATWCEPCERELPAFEAFAQEHTGDDAPIILAVNQGETDALAQKYLDERDISALTVLLDGDFKVSDAYAVGKIPVTYIVDQEGIIRFTQYGEMTEESLRNFLTEFLP